MRVLEWFRPRLWLASIQDLDLTALRMQGIRGIALDLDNTLVPYGSAAAPEEIRRWVGAAKAAGFALALVTNNRTRRARRHAADLDVPLASGWVKPATSMLRHALALMKTTAPQTALVGDQLVTDILAGNRLGLYTVLVFPLGTRESPTTRLLNRTVERCLFRLLRLSPPAGVAARPP